MLPIGPLGPEVRIRRSLVSSMPASRCAQAPPRSGADHYSRSRREIRQICARLTWVSAGDSLGWSLCRRLPSIHVGLDTLHKRVWVGVVVFGDLDPLRERSFHA